MKKPNLLNLALLFVLYTFNVSYAQQHHSLTIYETLAQLEAISHSNQIELFKIADNNQFSHVGEKNTIDKLILEFDAQQLTTLYEQRPLVIALRIPVNESTFYNVKLYRTNIYSPHANIGGITLSGTIATAVDENIYYRGVVNNSKTNWAAFSIGKQQLKGLIADSNGNWNIGQIKGQPHYVIHQDNSLMKGFSCEQAGLSKAISTVATDANNVAKRQACPIQFFWLGDYDLFLAHNSNLNATVSTLGDIFNNVAAIYQQEGVNIELKSNYAFFQFDGFNENSVVDAFLSFGQYIHARPEFIGHDLATFIALDYSNNPQGYAVIDALCDNSFFYNPLQGPDYARGRYSYARIQNYHYDYPIFSNTVNVITHEIGHNLGSRHTHWCGWPGGAIDNCSPPEPDQNGFLCNAGPPLDGGTIMSYCASVYGQIPFTNGFGTLPRQEILSDISNSRNCICSTTLSAPSDQEHAQYKLIPNPSSSSFSIYDVKANTEISLEHIKVIDLSGRIVMELANQTTVNIEHIPNGVYLLVGKSNNDRMINQKLIVKH